jgi:hypothetical protein
MPPAERNAAEIIAGRSDLDAFDINPTYRADLEKNNVFAKYDLKAMAEDGQLKIPARSIDAGGWSTWNNNSMLVIVYSTELVSEAEAPTNWESCLDPKWGIFVLPTLVFFSAFFTSPSNWEMATAISSPLILIAVGLTYVYNRVVVRQSQLQRFATVSGRGGRRRRIDLGK